MALRSHGSTNLDFSNGLFLTNIISFYDNSFTSVGGDRVAAKYCDALDYGGYQDWYLLNILG